MLDKYRQNVDFILEPLATRAGMGANTMSYLSFLFALAAGAAAYLSYQQVWLLPLTALFVILNGLFDALDGKIARMRGETGAKGDFIDHVIDRFSDVLMLGGIIASPWIDKRIGIPALAAVLLTSYLGTQAQAVSGRRLYAGVLGRADRLVLLFFALIIQFFMPDVIFGLYVLEWLMVYFAMAGTITIIQRYYAVMKWFT